eukprot:m.362463 g.362463  ORF g.362463 m.362463 type:complete len:365 (-) comp16649_c1_seq32:3397-4491(-)
MQPTAISAAVLLVLIQLAYGDGPVNNSSRGTSGDYNMFSLLLSEEAGTTPGAGTRLKVVQDACRRGVQQLNQPGAIPLIDTMSDNLKNRACATDQENQARWLVNASRATASDRFIDDSLRVGIGKGGVTVSSNITQNLNVMGYVDVCEWKTVLDNSAGLNSTGLSASHPIRKLWYDEFQNMCDIIGSEMKARLKPVNSSDGTCTKTSAEDVYILFGNESIPRVTPGTAKMLHFDRAPDEFVNGYNGTFEYHVEIHIPVQHYRVEFDARTENCVSKLNCTGKATINGTLQVSVTVDCQECGYLDSLSSVSFTPLPGKSDLTSTWSTQCSMKSMDGLLEEIGLGLASNASSAVHKTVQQFNEIHKR